MKISNKLYFISILAIAVMLIFTGCPTISEPASNLPSDAPESYNSASINPEDGDFTISAKDFVALMDAGWNLGNTLDANSNGVTGLSTETSWQQPITTQAMITALKNSGIKTLRIPVTWHNHVDDAFTIDDEWMDRVKEVVDYAVNEDLYVIINIHHDNEKDAYFPDSAHYDRSYEFVKRIWTQVALIFRNYDEHLIFELLNEPRLTGTTNEWNWDDNDSKKIDSAEVIGNLEQVALDEIRATGSNNSERYIMITPYVASPWAALSSYFVIPEDTVSDKLILSVHAYTPYSFAMQDPGDSTFNSSHEKDIDSFMDALNNNFVVDRGIPVIIGEYGATNKNNLSDRVAWFSYYCNKAASYGMSTILWDNGNYVIPASGSYNELYGYYNREAKTWYFPSILDEIIQAYQ